MNNSVLLVLQLVVFYSFVIIAFRFFKKDGVIAWSVMATLAANIEVLIQVRAFGIDMTLGNILFATTFISTDIVSELYGKKDADKLVNLNILVSAMFVIISQSWLLFTPGSEDFITQSVHAVFRHTPRLVISSLAVYCLVQKIDVWLYHKIWDISTSGSDRRKKLWLRNNGATIISQTINAFAFNFLAFAGIFSTQMILKIDVSTLVIYIITSLADTPVIYLCRRIHENALH